MSSRAGSLAQVERAALRYIDVVETAAERVRTHQSSDSWYLLSKGIESELAEARWDLDSWSHAAVRAEVDQAVGYAERAWESLGDRPVASSLAELTRIEQRRVVMLAAAKLEQALPPAASASFEIPSHGSSPHIKRTLKQLESAATATRAFQNGFDELLSDVTAISFSDRARMHHNAQAVPEARAATGGQAAEGHNAMLGAWTDLEREVALQRWAMWPDQLSAARPQAHAVLTSHRAALDDLAIATDTAVKHKRTLEKILRHKNVNPKAASAALNATAQLQARAEVARSSELALQQILDQHRTIGSLPTWMNAPRTHSLLQVDAPLASTAPPPGTLDGVAASMNGEFLGFELPSEAFAKGLHGAVEAALARLETHPQVVLNAPAGDGSGSWYQASVAPHVLVEGLESIQHSVRNGIERAAALRAPLDQAVSPTAPAVIGLPSLELPPAGRAAAEAAALGADVARWTAVVEHTRVTLDATGRLSPDLLPRSIGHGKAVRQTNEFLTEATRHAKLANSLLLEGGIDLPHARLALRNLVEEGESARLSRVVVARTVDQRWSPAAYVKAPTSTLQGWMPAFEQIADGMKQAATGTGREWLDQALVSGDPRVLEGAATVARHAGVTDRLTLSILETLGNAPKSGTVAAQAALASDSGRAAMLWLDSVSTPNRSLVDRDVRATIAALEQLDVAAGATQSRIPAWLSALNIDSVDGGGRVLPNEHREQLKILALPDSQAILDFVSKQSQRGISPQTIVAAGEIPLGIRPVEFATPAFDQLVTTARKIVADSWVQVTSAPGPKPPSNQSLGSKFMRGNLRRDWELRNQRHLDSSRAVEDLRVRKGHLNTAIRKLLEEASLAP